MIAEAIYLLFTALVVLYLDLGHLDRGGLMIFRSCQCRD